MSASPGSDREVGSGARAACRISRPPAREQCPYPIPHRAGAPRAAAHAALLPATRPSSRPGNALPSTQAPLTQPVLPLHAVARKVDAQRRLGHLGRHLLLWQPHLPAAVWSKSRAGQDGGRQGEGRSLVEGRRGVHVLLRQLRWGALVRWCGARATPRRPPPPPAGWRRRARSAARQEPRPDQQASEWGNKPGGQETARPGAAAAGGAPAYP